MNLITTQSALDAFAKGASEAEYITVDTEFLRETTYFAKLCLIQIAYPGEGHVAAIDVLAKGLDLAPVIALFRDENIVKVFHSARQDLEILYHDYNVLPKPFFDTQIAAMVDGYGDQVAYETLVRSIAKGSIDKSHRFTNWSKRPLSDGQLEYALADVTYLREIYEKLNADLVANGRIEWVREELEALLDPKLYEINPDEAYLRVRSRVSKPKFMAYVKEIAAFRERYAVEKNVPRGRVFKDDALLEAAAQRPKDLAALKNLRLWKHGFRTDIGQGVIKAVAEADNMPVKAYPKVENNVPENKAPESVVDLLKVFLKAQSERFDVAPRLICTSSQLEKFASNPDSDGLLNQGWRKQIFGDPARRIIAGEAGLMADGKFVKLVAKDEL